MHNIPFEFGYKSYVALRDIARIISVTYQRVLVKGPQKAELCRHLFTVPIIDLEEYDCPNLSNLNDKYGRHSDMCFYHREHKPKSYHCAQLKTLLLTNWVDPKFKQRFWDAKFYSDSYDGLYKMFGSPYSSGYC
jgi:hypothetical protein